MTPNQDEVVRVRLRYPDIETFIERFAANVTRGGIFLASREPRPVGDVLRFEIVLKVGPPVLSGEGRVTWVKEFNASEPHRPYGMGVQFMYIDPESRPLLDRLLQRKETAGNGPAAVSGPPATGRATAAFMPLGNRIDEIEDATVRRALDRARVLAARTDDLDALLVPEPNESVSLSQALRDLPRILGSRRQTGLFRTLPESTPIPVLGERPVEPTDKDA